MNRANEPRIVHYEGHAIAIEVENVGHREIRHIPVYLVKVNILPGSIDNPEVLFGAGMQAAYADVLELTHRRPHQDDRVVMGVYHENLRSNHGSFYLLNRSIRGEGPHDTALKHYVDAWEEVQQSDDTVHLNEGPLKLEFTFTLADLAGPPPRVHLPMGAHNHHNKKKMYQRTIYDDFYTNTNALKKTPDTAEGLCWPMAFLACQLRRHGLDETGEKIITLKETEAEKNPHTPTPLHRTIPIHSEADIRLFTTHSPHICCQHNGELQLLLFNPYRVVVSRVDNVYKYRLEDAQTLGELDAWKTAARLIHAHVEIKKGVPVNMHNFYESLQAYADVFEVHIHVLRVECQLNESHVFHPSSTEETPPRFIDHIYVVFGDAEGNFHHAHAVTNRRKMLYKHNSVNDISLHNYCDYCATQTQNNHLSKQEGLKHMSNCLRKLRVSSRGESEHCTRPEYFRQELQLQKPTFRFKVQKDKNKYKCNVCTDIVPKYDLKSHLCTFALPCKVPAKPIPELQNPPQTPNLWVYDIESAQVRCENVQDARYEHIPNCICLRPVYGPDRFHFHNTTSFCEFLLTDPRFHGSTIFAHNGGSYDHQFILQYLEKNCIEHTCVPRPGSSHKYLELKITRGEDLSKCISLKDFVVFMSYSLKEIASSFGLPIQKGDFPHRFNDGTHDDYVGSFPPLGTYSPEDKRSAQERQDIVTWWEEQANQYCSCPTRDEHHCNKPLWNFQTEIQKYCWLDTDILAQAVAKFREEHIAFGNEMQMNHPDWQPTPIDPLMYLTQPSAALQFFLQGHAQSTTKVRAGVSERRVRSGWSKKSLVWLERIQREEGFEYIQHAGNSRREFYDALGTNAYVDGYAPSERVVFEFLGCYWHGCPKCHRDKLGSLSHIHPTRNIPWKTIFEATEEKLKTLQSVYGNENVRYVWECDFDASLRLHPLTSYEDEVQNVIEHREMFYGGRTEVFSPYAKATEEVSIQHHDVTSMYPYICAHKMLPIGHPIIYFGHMCDRSRLSRIHSDPYFGYVRCRVTPNVHCVLGLLPCKMEGKLQFDLIPKVGVWFTEELLLAMSQGYVVEEIYEVLHFDSNNRSETYFREYMAFFMRIKQESEGWVKSGGSSETPSEEEKSRVIDELFHANGGIARMRPERVGKNKVRRALAKLNLNCLWGKFAQNDDEQSQHKIVYTYDSWAKDIFKNPTVDQTSVRYREMQGGAYMCYYRTQTGHTKTNPHVNIWIASAVTAWARCILHSQMLVVGPEKVLYCDTDSIVFLQRRDDLHEYTARGLGKWTNEIEDPEDEITEFLALAPKCYMKVERHTPTGHMKAKGVRMTISNQEKTTKELVRKLLEDAFVSPPVVPQEPLKLDHMTIYSNSMDSRYPYATVFTRYAQKVLRIVLSKRTPVPFPLQSRALLSEEKGGIERLYLAPYSPLKIEDNPNYNSVYSRYL